VTNYTRDPNTGDIIQVIDVVSGGTNRVTAISYNRFGNVESVTRPEPRRSAWWSIRLQLTSCGALSSLPLLKFWTKAYPARRLTRTATVCRIR